MTLTRVSIPSPNYSSRGGAGVRLIVIHSSEGAQTYQSLGNFFRNPSSGVSSHVGIDDTPNTIGEYVTRNQKAWTAANANPVAVQAELCTPSGASAAWTTAIWQSHAVMLQNTAQWIAEEAKAFGLPIVRLTPAQAQSNGRGVCQHLDLGSWGGGHVDCGPGFPIDQVIAMAQSGAPIPPPPIQEIDMKAAPCVFSMQSGGQEAFYVDANGRLVHWFFNKTSQKWTQENLSTGWDADSQLVMELYNGNTYQVWGTFANGKRGQCYWSGKAWVTQTLG